MGIVFLFLLPVLLQWHGIFVDDVRSFSFPNAVFQARYLQRGIVPLWDPHTFAGGMPFVTRIDAFTFYLPQWLAGLLGNTVDIDRAYRDLMLIPIIIHCLWGAAGGYVLGRGGMGLSRAGAAALGVTFALSNSMTGAMLNPPMVMSLPWLPWMASAVLIYLRRPSAGRLLLGAAVFALAIPSWSNYVIQGVFLASLCTLAVLARRLAVSGPAAVFRPAAGLAAMLGLAGLLTAPYLISLYRGTAYVRETLPLTYEFVTVGPRSVPWRWLATLFVPELFASTNFSSFWGVAEEQQMFWCEAMLTRGMFLWLPAFLAVWSGVSAAVARRRKETGAISRLDRWTWFSSGLLLFSIILILGRHTPLFAVLYRFCPLFRIPYASRWHPLVTISLSLLTGIGVTRLLGRRPALPIAARGRLAGYLVFATVATLAAVSLPLPYFRKLSDFGWLLRNPVLYWGASALTLAVLIIWWRPKRAARAVVLLALLDLLRNAALDTYRPMGLTWAPEQDAGRRPSDTALYNFMARAAAYDNDPMVRTGYSRVFADAGALLYGGHSLLGVGVKPMPPDVFNTLDEICEGMPNETVLKNPAIPFVGNMSTGFWWYGRPEPPRPDWELVASAPETGLHLFRLPEPLPRIFTLDRLLPAEEDEQRRALINDDLRRAVMIDPADPALMSRLSGRSGPLPEGDVPNHFAGLQRANPVSRADFSHPNRLEIELEVTVPSLLVVTDAWHPGWEAEDNGSPAAIHKVNHLHRGVWLAAGRHLVSMEFRPWAVTVGRWFVLAGAAVVVALFLAHIKGVARR